MQRRAILNVRTLSGQTMHTSESQGASSGDVMLVCPFHPYLKVRSKTGIWTWFAADTVTATMTFIKGFNIFHHIIFILYNIRSKQQCFKISS
jgi:predicted molibdopterin-dependent oxidoreductase YjgC